MIDVPGDWCEVCHACRSQLCGRGPTDVDVAHDLNVNQKSDYIYIYIVVLLSPTFSKKGGGTLFLVFHGAWCVGHGAWRVVPNF